MITINKNIPKILLVTDLYPAPPGGMETHAYEFKIFLADQRSWKFCGEVAFASTQSIVNKTKKKSLTILPKKEIYNPNSLINILHKKKIGNGDVIFFNSLYWIRTFSALRKNFPKTALILRSGGNDIMQSEIDGAGETLAQRQKYVIKNINFSINLLIVNSKYSFNRLKNIGIKKNLMKIITGGVDIKRFSPVDRPKKEKLRKKLKLPLNKLIIFSSCRLVPFKKIEKAIKAVNIIFSLKKPLHYLIAGDGPNRLAIKKMIGSLKLSDKVSLVGSIPINKIHNYYQASDIYYLTPGYYRKKVIKGSYIHTETMGRSFCEAMSCGLPVITTKVGGIPEIVRDRKTGILVSPPKIKSLAKALNKLVDKKEKILKFGMAGREVAVKYFSWQIIFKRYFKFFQQLKLEKNYENHW